jgi:hypothetical protein
VRNGADPYMIKIIYFDNHPQDNCGTSSSNIYDCQILQPRHTLGDPYLGSFLKSLDFCFVEFFLKFLSTRFVISTYFITVFLKSEQLGTHR